MKRIVITSFPVCNICGSESVGYSGSCFAKCESCGYTNKLQTDYNCDMKLRKKNFFAYSRKPSARVHLTKTP
jgi:tRNA(Ile2) C34 agmatinyltransferase TiaS